MAYSTVGIFSRAFSFYIGKIPDFSNALGSNLPQSSCPRALARSPGKFFLDTLKVTSLSDELLKTSRHLLLRGPKNQHQEAAVYLSSLGEGTQTLCHGPYIG